VCLTAPAENVLKTALAREYLMLARVTRTVGGGRVVVQLLDGTADVSVPIGGSIKMKGRAATKTDRSNCMCQGDIVVVRGAQASGKVSAAAAAQIRTIFDELSVSYPKGFFTATGSAEAVDDEFAYEWDRSDQAARETAAVAAARALAARKSAMRAGETVAEEAEVEAEVDIEAI
jgi:chloramphenicol 3-O-phosphotransferase